MTQAVVIRQSRSSLALTQPPSAYCEDKGCWQKSLCIIHTAPLTPLQREAQAHHSRKPQNTYCEDNGYEQISPCIIHASPETLLPSPLIRIIIEYLTGDDSAHCNILEAARGLQRSDFQERTSKCFLTMARVVEWQYFFNQLKEGEMLSLNNLPAPPQGEPDPQPLLKEMPKNEPELFHIIGKEFIEILRHIKNGIDYAQIHEQVLDITQRTLGPISKRDKEAQQWFISAFTSEEFLLPPEITNEADLNRRDCASEACRLYKIMNGLFDALNPTAFSDCEAASLLLDVIENITQKSHYIPFLQHIKKQIDQLSCDKKLMKLDARNSYKINKLKRILEEKLLQPKASFIEQLFSWSSYK